MSEIGLWVRRQRARFDLWWLQVWYRRGYLDAKSGRRDEAGRPAQGPHRIAYLTGWADGLAEAGRPLGSVAADLRRNQHPEAADG